MAAFVCTFLLAAGSLLGQQPPARQGRAGAPRGGGPGRGGPPPPMSVFVTRVGAGRGGVTWHAYLSTQGPNAVNARDRIGNFIGAANSLDEKGQPVPSTFPGSERDILTGSTLDGRAYTDTTRDYTCGNWTSAADGNLADGVVPDPTPPGVPSARLGHADTGNIVPSWNSSHPSRGGGRLYCFAVS